MNILISTTTNWNVGDNFIAFGVKNILKHIFPEQPNYIHYDRNPNNMIDYPHNQRMKKGLRGTFMNNPIDWNLIDIVILAGTPEWLHHPLEPIYEGLVDHPEIPLWAIGIGYTEPQFVLPLTDAEVKVLKRENTLIITRQQELSDRLEPILERKIPALPCPALFCFEDFPEKKREKLYIVTTMNVVGDDSICHSVEEINGYKNFISSDPHDVLNYIGEYRIVKSQRLHGTIAAISSGAKATSWGDDFRIKQAMELFSEVIEADRTDITVFKTRILNQYINIIKEYAKPFTTK